MAKTKATKKPSATYKKVDELLESLSKKIDSYRNKGAKIEIKNLSTSKKNDY